MTTSLRQAAEPLSRAHEAMRLVHSLAQRKAAPDRVEREVAAVIGGWIGQVGVIEAIEILRDQLITAAEDTMAEVGNLDREDVAGIRAGQRVVACLEAARDAAAAALAGL